MIKSKNSKLDTSPNEAHLIRRADTFSPSDAEKGIEAERATEI